MTKQTIGFIGLGLMGGAMVECLQKAGHPVVALGNRDRTGIEAAIARGASEAATAADLTRDADIVMLCMGTSDHVEGRVYGDAGILSAVKLGQVVIDFGTSLPGSTQKIARDMAAKGAAYLDAPLGRTPAHAKDGLLNIMCAGDKDAYDRVLPVLQTVGENVFHLGASGAGHTIKLINNFMGMTTAAAMSEAFAMADMAGIERQQLYDVMSAGPLRSGMMDFVQTYATTGAPGIEFAIQNAAKDVGYYREMAKGLNVTSRMSGAAHDTLQSAVAAGMGEEMVTHLVDHIANGFKGEAS